MNTSDNPTHNDWEVTDLRRGVRQALGGGTPSRRRADYWGGDIPWTTSARIDETGNVSIADWLTPEGLANSSSNLIPSGALLVGTRVGVGKAAVAEADIAISQDLTGLIVEGDVFDVGFLRYAMAGPGLQEQFRRATRGSTIKGVPREDLLAFKVPRPPLSEQRAIAHVLRTVQRAREQTDQVLLAVLALKQSLRRYLLTYGPVPIQRVGEVQQAKVGDDEFPSHWSSQPFTETFVRVRNGPLHEQRSVSGTGSVPVLTQGSDGFLGFHDGDPGVGPDDLPVVTFANHTCAVRYVDFPFSTIQNVFVMKPKDHVDIRFFYHFLTGRVHQSGYRGHWPQAKEKPVLLPPKVDQMQIAEFLDTVDRKLAVDGRCRDALAALFDSLLHDLMSARLRVDHLVERVSA
jgi:type I restriction enzyme S subunit